MRVFVTGASGFVGSAVVQELLAAGHQVLGLARSDASAAAIGKAGAEVHRGALDDPQSLKNGANAADGVVHCAFIHDFANFKASCDMDRQAIEVFGSALAGTNKPLLITSGIGLLSPGRQATENDHPPTGAEAHPRGASEQVAHTLAARGIRTSIVRLPPSVHGEGDHGFVPILIGIAREKGVSAYIGDGANRWPAVHRLDAARAYRLILERSTITPSPGKAEIYHAVADEGIPTKEIAEAISHGLQLSIASKAPGDSAAHFGWIGHFFSLDIPASSAQTRERLGWEPTNDSLLADLGKGHYFGH